MSVYHQYYTGRHSAYSTADGKVMISLGKMRSVHMDVRNKTVAVQGGAR
jgi:hypothetical protein